MLGLSASSVKTLAAVSWLVTDPRAQSLISEVARTQAQAVGGRTVLMDRPIS
jgi:hypothetical protein